MRSNQVRKEFPDGLADHGGRLVALLSRGLFVDVDIFPIAVECHKAVTDPGQHAADLLLRSDYVSQRQLALALNPALFGNVSKDENGALEAAPLVLHRRPAVVNRN